MALMATRPVREFLAGDDIYITSFPEVAYDLHHHSVGEADYDFSPGIYGAVVNADLVVAAGLLHPALTILDDEKVGDGAGLGLLGDLHGLILIQVIDAVGISGHGHLDLWPFQSTGQGQEAYDEPRRQY